LANDNGWTVAHEAACYGYLPPDFDWWNLTDKDGQTVAQTAYEYNRLPPNFDKWDLIKKSQDDYS
jgi:hypothetical protein